MHGHLASFPHQVEIRFHGWESNCQPFHLVLCTSPLSSSSFGSSRNVLYRVIVRSS